MQKSTPKHNITSKYKFFRTVQQLSTFNSIPLTYLLYTAIRFILTKIESWIVRPPLLWHQTCSSLTYNFHLNMLLTKSSNCPYTATIVSLYHGHSLSFLAFIRTEYAAAIDAFFPISWCSTRCCYCRRRTVPVRVHFCLPTQATQGISS